MRVKYLLVKHAHLVSGFPNFSASGSVAGMKNNITATMRYLLGAVRTYIMYPVNQIFTIT